VSVFRFFQVRSVLSYRTKYRDIGIVLGFFAAIVHFYSSAARRNAQAHSLHVSTKHYGQDR